jgi:hypothetical protein
MKSFLLERSGRPRRALVIEAQVKRFDFSLTSWVGETLVTSYSTLTRATSQPSLGLGPLFSTGIYTLVLYSLYLCVLEVYDLVG